MAKHKVDRNYEENLIIVIQKEILVPRGNNLYSRFVLEDVFGDFNFAHQKSKQAQARLDWMEIIWERLFKSPG